MTVVVTLLVRDEADVVAATVEHHLALGAAHVVATDNGSVDGTREVLAEYERAGVLTLIDEPSHDYRQAEWVTRMARRAAAEHGADWVLNVDADEFWRPFAPGADLPSVFAALPDDVGSVVAMREDLVGRAHGGPWPGRLVWRDTRTVSTRGTPLAPKVAHRGDPDVEVPQGNHGATGPRLGRVADARPLQVLHVPMRSYEQYERKIRNGGSAYESNPDHPKDLGWHWREDYAALREGRLEAEYRRRCLTARRFVAGVATRRLVHDRSLQRWLEVLRGRAIRLALLDAVLAGRPPAV